MSFFNAHTFVSVGCLPNLILHQLHVVLFGSHSMKLTCRVSWGSFLAMVQVQIGTHSFTFDHVYGSTGSPSSAMFDECVAPLVNGLFQGYNATVLAYGQVNPSLCGKLLVYKQSITYALQYLIPL